MESAAHGIRVARSGKSTRSRGVGAAQASAARSAADQATGKDVQQQCHIKFQQSEEISQGRAPCSRWLDHVRRRSVHLPCDHENDATHEEGHSNTNEALGPQPEEADSDFFESVLRQ